MLSSRAALERRDPKDVVSSLANDDADKEDSQLTASNHSITHS